MNTSANCVQKLNKDTENVRCARWFCGALLKLFRKFEPFLKRRKYLFAKQYDENTVFSVLVLAAVNHSLMLHLWQTLQCIRFGIFLLWLFCYMTKDIVQYLSENLYQYYIYVHALGSPPRLERWSSPRKKLFFGLFTKHTNKPTSFIVLLKSLYQINVHQT